MKNNIINPPVVLCKALYTVSEKVSDNKVAKLHAARLCVEIPPVGTHIVRLWG